MEEIPHPFGKVSLPCRVGDITQKTAIRSVTKYLDRRLSVREDEKNEIFEECLESCFCFTCRDVSYVWV